MTVGVGLLIILAVSFCESRPYSWADRVIAQGQENGWKVFSKNDRWSDFARPWTLIKSPIVQIGFYRPEEVRRVSTERYYAHVGWALNPVAYGDDAGFEESDLLVDCAADQMATVIASESSGFEVSEWRPVTPDTPGQDLLITLCR